MRGITQLDGEHRGVSSGKVAMRYCAVGSWVMSQRIHPIRRSLQSRLIISEIDLTLSNHLIREGLAHGGTMDQLHILVRITEYI
jgi:hypothetical protein